MPSDEEIIEASSLGSVGARGIRAKVSPIWVNVFSSSRSEEIAGDREAVMALSSPRALDLAVGSDVSANLLVVDRDEDLAQGFLRPPPGRVGLNQEEVSPRSAHQKGQLPFGQALLAAVQALSLELDLLRHESGAVESARFAEAEDELAAIHEEMRQQQQEISELISGVGSSSEATLRRFLSTLPLATLLTSSTGLIIEANGAAHSALRIPMGALTGKPVFAFIAQDDRRRLRSALSQACAGDELLQAAALVTPRRGTAVPSHFALVREVDGRAMSLDGLGEAEPDTTVVRWVIVPNYEAVDGPPSHEQLEALTRLCRLGAEDGDLRVTLRQVAQLCVQAIAEADDVSLLVGNPLEPTLSIASSAVAQHLDGLQQMRAGGPTFDAYRSRRPVALDGDAVAEHPGLADDEQARSVGSLLAVPLVSDDLPSGVLTVYGAGPGSAATMAVLRQVMPFVEAAQALIRDTRAHEEMRRTQEQLEAALTARGAIDQAKGMIMISLKCSADDAFGHLVRMSSARHKKVRDVAQSMVDDVLKKRDRFDVDPSDDEEVGFRSL